VFNANFSNISAISWREQIPNLTVRFMVKNVKYAKPFDQVKLTLEHEHHPEW